MRPFQQLNWHLPIQIQFGWGLLANFMLDEPTVVLADESAVSREMYERLSARWGGLLRAWVWLRARESEITQIEALAKAVWGPLAESNRGTLLAIGGGTTLDIAKVLRWRPLDLERAEQPLGLWEGQGVGLAEFEIERHPLIVWPTTAGTGSEVSKSATVWDRRGGSQRKLAWQPPNGQADAAYVDPELTLTCPPKVTRDSALDALSHALEALWNRRASVVTRPFAMRSISLILKYLPVVVADPTNAPARTALSEASLLAGMAMSETQTALAHALSYDLTLHEGLSHGEAVAVWLPFVAEFATNNNPEMQSILREALATQQPPHEFLAQWLMPLGVLPRSLSNLKGGTADLQAALNSARGMNQSFTKRIPENCQQALG